MIRIKTYSKYFPVACEFTTVITEGAETFRNPKNNLFFTAWFFSSLHATHTQIYTRYTFMTLPTPVNLHADAYRMSGRGERWRRRRSGTITLYYSIPVFRACVGVRSWDTHNNTIYVNTSRNYRYNAKATAVTWWYKIN